MLHLKGEVSLFRLSFVIVVQPIHRCLAPLWKKPSNMCATECADHGGRAVASCNGILF